VPAKLAEAGCHGILQLATFRVMDDLVGGRLADIKNGFARQVVWLNLVIHRIPPGRWCRGLSEPGVADGSGAMW
jgi:hypothetical protein